MEAAPNDDNNRAKHEGGLFPGTLVAKPGYALIPWGGKAHKKEEFQVTLIIIHPSLYECHHCPGAGAEHILAHSHVASLLRGRGAGGGCPGGAQRGQGGPLHLPR